MGNCLTCLKTSPRNSAGDDGDDERDTVTAPVAATARTPTDRDKLEKETDELLTQNLGLHLTNVNIDSHQSSLKKMSALSNGNANNMSETKSIVREHQVSDNTLNALFEEYKDHKEDAILSEGIERLCNDLGYKPDDFAILILAWRLDASQMCRFTKSEFIQGCQLLNADTVTEIRRRLEQIVEKLQTDVDMFKQLYRFTFRFGLEPGHRIVSLEMAIILWRLVFTVHTPNILDRWLYFLEQHPNIRGVPKDTWNMFLNFAETFDITSYDDTEAWPSLFDDFVEYETDRANQNLIDKSDVS